MKNVVVENMIRQQLNIDTDIVVLFTHYVGGFYYFDIKWYTDEVEGDTVSTYLNKTTIGLPSIKVRREKLD